MPGKNTKLMCGKPLIAWTIEQALESGVFKKIILMTDDKEIVEISKKFGISEIFMLPPELATDMAYVGDAIKYMLDEYEKKGENFENFILLEPTAPGRQVHHIKDVSRIIDERSDADSVVTITEMSPNQGIHKLLSMNQDNFVSRAADGALMKNLSHHTQSIGPSYYINSAVYACRRSNFNKGSLWGNSTVGYIMDRRYSFDIDTQEDWEIAEFKMSKLKTDEKA